MGNLSTHITDYVILKHLQKINDSTKSRRVEHRNSQFENLICVDLPTKVTN